MKVLGGVQNAVPIHSIGGSYMFIQWTIQLRAVVLVAFACTWLEFISEELSQSRCIKNTAEAYIIYTYTPTVPVHLHVHTRHIHTCK